MASDRRRTCRNCGHHDSEVGAISWRGKCSACSEILLYANIDQMMARSGPNFDRWRRSMVLCAHPELVDALGRKA